MDLLGAIRKSAKENVQPARLFGDADWAVDPSPPTQPPSPKQLIDAWDHLLLKKHLEAAHRGFVGEAADSKRLRLLNRVVHKVGLLPSLERLGPLKGASLTQLKLLLGTSAVQEDLSKFTDYNASCPCCDEDVAESVEHFLLRCSRHASVREEGLARLQFSPWGIRFWNECYFGKELADTDRAALLLGHPRPHNPCPGVFFPLEETVLFVKEMWQSRCDALEELTDEECSSSSSEEDLTQRSTQRNKQRSASRAVSSW